MSQSGDVKTVVKKMSLYCDLEIELKVIGHSIDRIRVPVRLPL